MTQALVPPTPFDDVDLICPDEIDMTDMIRREYEEFERRVAKAMGKRVMDDYYAKYAVISQRKKQLLDQLRENKRLLAEITKTGGPEIREPDLLKMAITVSFFETLIDQIAWWSKDETMCHAFVEQSKSYLYPAVYEQLSTHNTDYFFKRVPDTAEAVVLAGRGEVMGWVLSDAPCLRSQISGETRFGQASAPNADQTIPNWWVSTGLPLLYGDVDPAWETVEPWPMSEVEKFQNDEFYRNTQQVSLAKLFAFNDTIKEMVREFSDIPEFQTRMMDLRFTVKD